MNKIEVNPDFKFSFDDDYQLFDVQVARGYIESYDMVRACVKYKDGPQIDYPLKTKENYFNEIARLNGRASDIESVEIYQSTHMFDINDYL